MSYIKRLKEDTETWKCVLQPASPQQRLSNPEAEKWEWLHCRSPRNEEDRCVYFIRYLTGKLALHYTMQFPV